MRISSYHQVKPPSTLELTNTSLLRATKGIGRTQPVNWKDAGEVLGNDALKGCHMPDGPCDNNADPKAYLQYNEVRAS